MVDAALRRFSAPVMDHAGRRIARTGIPALAVTGAGWAAGAGACLAIVGRLWPLALALWLANRLLDGLDGGVARASQVSDLGGFLDIVADFSVYGAIVVAIAMVEPAARLACVALLASYYVSGTALLAFSSIAERKGIGTGDGRSVRFSGGLAEGTETIAVYVLFFLLPRFAPVIAWTFAAMVTITAAQRTWRAVNLLRGAGGTPDGRAAPAPDTGLTKERTAS